MKYDHVFVILFPAELCDLCVRNTLCWLCDDLFRCY